MIDKAIRIFFYLLFFITPLLMYPATSEIFEFNKILFIYMMTALIASTWIIKMVINKKIIIKKTPLDIPISIFLISQVVSTIFSIDVHTSLFGYYGRFNGGLISIICYILLFYAFISNNLDLKKLLKVILVSSLIVILWGLPGKFGRDLSCPTFNTILTHLSGTLNQTSLADIWSNKFNNSCWSRETNVFDPANRMFSTLGQPNWLGAYLVANFFIGLYFLIKNRDKIMYVLINLSYLLLNLSAIVFTRSRSALVAGAGALFIMALYYILKKSRKTFFIILGLSVLLTLIIGAFNRNKIANYFTFNDSPTSVTESSDIRKIVWKGAVDLGMKYPLVGTGVETFAYSYFFVRPAAHNLTSEWDFVYNKAHNEFLNYFATTGFVGLTAYLWLIVAFTAYVVKANPGLLNLSLYLAWLTILITNFFGFSTTTTSLLFYLIPAMVIYKESTLQDNKKKEKLNSLQWVGISAAFGITIYTAISLHGYFNADILYGQGLYYAKPQISDYQKAAYNYEAALKMRGEHVYEDKFSYALAYLSTIASYQKNSGLANQLIQAAEYYNIQSLKSSPKNILYWKTRAKNKYLFYLASSDKRQINEGLEALQQATLLAPTDTKIPYSLAVFYSLLYDLEEEATTKNSLSALALKSIDRSITLKKNFYDSWLLKGQLQKKFGQGEAARETFEFILKNIRKDDEATLKELEEL